MFKVGEVNGYVVFVQCDWIVGRIGQCLTHWVVGHWQVEHNGKPAMTGIGTTLSEAIFESRR